jgi:hypothetical protein
LGADTSAPSDVLVMNMGIAYALWRPQGIEPGALGEWWRAQVRTFILTLKQVGYRGRVVYFPATPLRRQNQPDSWQQIDTDISRFNSEILPVILAEADWIFIDLVSVVRPVLYSHLYEDAAHFPGLLSQIAWHLILAALCPAPER